MASPVKIIPRLKLLPLDRADDPAPVGRKRIEVAARTLEVQEKLGKRVVNLVEETLPEEEIESIKAVLKHGKGKE